MLWRSRVGEHSPALSEATQNASLYKLTLHLRSGFDFSVTAETLLAVGQFYVSTKAQRSRRRRWSHGACLRLPPAVDVASGQLACEVCSVAGITLYGLGPPESAPRHLTWLAVPTSFWYKNAVQSATRPFPQFLDL